jgi:hypothetical protein
VASSAVLGRAAVVHGAPSVEPFEVRDLRVDGDRRIGQRFTLLVPKHLAPGKRVPLLVALHGLGETGDQRMGAYAWLERYGLGDAYRRLVSPPIQKVTKHPYWAAGRLDEVNAELRARPFRGLAVACPYTPNVYKAPSRNAMLDDYADWIVDAVLPRARSEAPVLTDVAHTSLDGCSLGGYVGIEVFLRKAEHFGAWGSVQGALGKHRVHRYAERFAETLARVGKRPIHLETSSGDVFREVNELFSRQLTKRGVAHQLRIGRGPHNQPWLRDEGTLEMLLWHDRALG